MPDTVYAVHSATDLKKKHGMFYSPRDLTIGETVTLSYMTLPGVDEGEHSALPPRIVTVRLYASCIDKRNTVGLLVLDIDADKLQHFAAFVPA